MAQNVRHLFQNRKAIIIIVALVALISVVAGFLFINSKSSGEDQQKVNENAISEASHTSQPAAKSTQQSKPKPQAQPVSVSVSSDVQPFEPLSEQENTSMEDNTPIELPAAPAIDISLIPTLDVAQDANQLIVVSVTGYSDTEGMFYLYSWNGTEWVEIIGVPCFVGEEGIGKASAGIARTPTGLYSIQTAFGNAPNPGCTGIEYIDVTPDLYWSGDNDVFYNKLISDKDVKNFDKSASEHLSAFGSVYNYCLDFGYNKDCIPGAGAAFFIHCSENRPTGGCIAIDEEYMVQLMQKVHIDCPVIIDITTNIPNY